ncbi:MAG: stage V sporulation protein AC [Christensenellales bacterium]|jgi:stage V sporulation protein AC
MSKESLRNLTLQEQREVKAYNEMVEQMMPKKKMWPYLLKAFLVGGIICTIGQFLRFAAEHWLGLDVEGVSSFSAIVLVFLGCTLTGIGVYDDIGKFAGAGSIVPITGFANSIVSPAMEFKREGPVLGIGANLFKLAGPVLVCGIGASIIVGLLSLLFK